LVVADIGISPELAEVEAVRVEAITAAEAARLIPRRPIGGHKGTFGWVLVAAGSTRYWGAAALAGLGAYRAGAGLVALAVPAAIRPALATLLPEATYPPVASEAVLDEAAARMILSSLESYQALLVGPGLHDAADFLVAMLAGLAASPRPMVLDADGLNLLAQMDGWAERLPSETILTPHPGEMARLLGADPAELKERDRVELAQEQAAAWGCVLLLKGAFTVVAAPDGRTTIVPFANPALATAGSGDVLSGVIAALLGQGLPAYEAAALGAYLHGAAAGLAAVQGGLLAREIADWVQEAWNVLIAEA
jgi:NAD(P)H-hydrate epimerase